MSFLARTTTTNLAMCKIGADGKVAVFNSAGSTHVILDVVGYFSTTARGRFVPLAPGHLLDTRPDGMSPVGPGSQTGVMVRGRGGVPATGVAAVVLNVTAGAPTASTGITVFPTGTTRPGAVSISARAGVDTSGLVVVRLGGGGGVYVHNSAGSTNLVVDVVGYFTA